MKPEQVLVRRERFGFGHMMLAFLGGAAAGAAVGMLTALRSGKETRAQLIEQAGDAKGRVVRVPEALRVATVAAKEAFEGALKD